MWIADNNDRIASLQYWIGFLNYTFIFLGIYVASSVLPGLSLFIILPPLWYLYLFIGSNIIFITYMVYILFMIKRYGWLSILVFLFIIPCVYLFISHGHDVNLSLFMGMCLLIVYILYCYLLKLAIPEWQDV